MQPYDLIVIGSGPGGQRAAIQGTKAGKRVAVIEKQASIGGVCINSGTIPSKTMREAVLHLSGFYDKNFYGTNYNSKDTCTMADLNFRVQHVVENEVGVIQSQLKRNNVTIIHGTGRFTSPHHIRVDNANGFGEFESEYIIIATGTKPSVNPKVPINGRNIINSDQILSMPQIPRTFIVVGGGVIGVEYACMFATLGVRVIIVEKRPRLLEFADTEMAVSYTHLDTAGRLHIDDELMKELSHLKKELQPSELLFIADSMIGQDAVRSAGEFHKRLGLTGVILTKLDGDARGGCLLYTSRCV